MDIYKEYTKKAIDRLESILQRLGIEYNFRDSVVDLKCPIHNSDTMGNSIIYLNDPFVWICFSGGCSDTFGKNILGLIRGTLKTTGQNSEWSDLFRFIDGDHTVCPIAQIIREAPELFKDESTLPDMKIPSKYYIARGFKEETLEYFGVGDAYNFPYKHKAIVPIRYIDGQFMGFSARSHYNK